MWSHPLSDVEDDLSERAGRVVAPGCRPGVLEREHPADSSAPRWQRRCSANEATIAELRLEAFPPADEATGATLSELVTW